MLTNLPPKNSIPSSSDLSNKNLTTYNDRPIEYDHNVLAAMKGFLESKGFSKESAESVAVTIMIQSKRENYNPMTIVETMKTLNEFALSQIISEILNYNRLKTSVLGSVQKITRVDAVARNIVA